MDEYILSADLLNKFSQLTPWVQALIGIAFCMMVLGREIKKFRQVVIVTHNANLVINADAEQIIVANNVEEELSYYSGSIENVSQPIENHPILGEQVKDHVCTILEGGRDAFEKRKRKYYS